MSNILTLLDLSPFIDNISYIIHGIWYNIIVFLISALVAVLIGLFVCLIGLSKRNAVRFVGLQYTQIFRSAPEYVLILWIYIALPSIFSSYVGIDFTFSPMFAAIIALGLVSSGYFSETFRSGFGAIPTGHIEAAQALGMSYFNIVSRIMIPQAVKLMLPEGLNNLVSLFKATTIVSVVSVPDLLYRVNVLNQYEMKPIPLYTGVAFVYFVLIFTFSFFARTFGNYWRKRASR
jgi:polar amino acid transport system permease protein